MKHRKNIVFVYLLLLSGFFIQGQSIDLTFTAINDTVYVPLDSLKVMNRTQGGDTMLYYPDTVLTLYYVGIEEQVQNNYRTLVQGVFPNPITTEATINIYVPGHQRVNLIVTDILGKPHADLLTELDEGMHEFRFIPGQDRIYLLSVITGDGIKTVKLINACSNQRQWCELSNINSNQSEIEQKASSIRSEFVFNHGDYLLFIGDSEWNNWGFCGFNAGYNLKGIYKWYGNGHGSDLFGFNTLPGGYREHDGSSGLLGSNSMIWSSMGGANFFGTFTNFDWSHNDVGNDDYFKTAGFSVRCIKD